MRQQIIWGDPTSTKPHTSRWHRNYEAMTEWYSRWYIELTSVGLPPEDHYDIDAMMTIIPLPVK